MQIRTIYRTDTAGRGKITASATVGSKARRVSITVDHSLTHIEKHRKAVLAFCEKHAPSPVSDLDINYRATGIVDGNVAEYWHVHI